MTESLSVCTPGWPHNLVHFGRPWQVGTEAAERRASLRKMLVARGMTNRPAAGLRMMEPQLERMVTNPQGGANPRHQPH